MIVVVLVAAATCGTKSLPCSDLKNFEAQFPWIRENLLRVWVPPTILHNAIRINIACKLDFTLHPGWLLWLPGWGEPPAPWYLNAVELAPSEVILNHRNVKFGLRDPDLALGWDLPWLEATYRNSRFLPWYKCGQGSFFWGENFPNDEIYLEIGQILEISEFFSHQIFKKI